MDCDASKDISADNGETMNKLRILIGFGWLLVLLSACSTQSGGLTLEDIPNGFTGPNVLVTTSDSATIRFDSGVPTVCNAAYGETTNYGQVATIPMLDGATLDHELTFIDLRPDTTYHYLITATDINGNTYQSSDFTFKTEPAETADLGINLLDGAQVVDVSSNFGGAANDETWGAESAIDGRSGSAWSSNGDGDEAYIEIELEQAVRIHTLRVHTRSMPNDTAQIFSFTVTSDAGETFGPFELPDATQLHSFDVDLLARALRFDVVSSNGGNTGFVELEAYGDPASSP
jgi:hypothetical protein